MLIELLPLAGGIVVLLFLSGFFSASETALMSLSRTEVKRMSSGTHSEKTVCGLLQKPQRLLSTILVGNMFVNVLLASIFAAFLNKVLDPTPGTPGLFERLAAFAFPGMADAGVERFGNIARSILNIFIVTPLLMVFGEQTPKVVAYANGVSISRKTAQPLSWLCVVLTPVNWILHVLGNFLLKILGQQTSGGWEEMTTDELLATISVGQETGATNGSEHNILARIVELGTINVKEVMTHRMDVIGVEDCLTLREAFMFARSKRHSWYPVFHDDLDDIWGMLSLVDFPYWRDKPEMDMELSRFRELGQATAGKKNPVYLPKFAPQAAHIDTLLHDMRQEAKSVVVVVDEHGGTAGIATLNDIIEELLGRFASGEEDEDVINVRKDGMAIVDGRAHLRTLQKKYGAAFDNEDGDSDTVGGLIMEHLGHIPHKDDTVSLDDGIMLRVKRMAGHRVRTVEIVPPANAEKHAAIGSEGGRQK